MPKLNARIHFTAVWQDVDGNEHRKSSTPPDDVLGIVFQHELDHLHSKLFVDYLNPTQLTMVRRRLKEMEKAYKKATGKVGSIRR